MSDATSTRTGTGDDRRPRPGKPEVLVAPPEVLERGLCAAVAAAKDADPLRPVVVVAPGEIAAAAVTGVLARGLGAAVNVEVFAYDDLVRTLADARHGGRPSEDLTRAQARVLARSVTAHAKGWFEPLAGTAGFADAFCDFLADLRGARLSPEALTRAGLPIEIRRKLSSLATSAREFEDRRGRRRSHEDRAEDATVVVERTMGGVPLMLYGVVAATDADARLLERVCHATAATAFLPSLRAPASASLAPTLEVLRRCGAEAASSPPEPEAAAEPSALTHLQRHLFRVPGDAAPDDATVRLVSAAGPAAEAREAADACLRWAAAGIAFADMAVLVPPRSQLHADLVVSALGRVGVPCADLTNRPPAGTAAGRAALQYATAAEAGDGADSWADRVEATVGALDEASEGYDEVVAALGELRVDGMCGPPDDAAFAGAVRVALTDPAPGAAARHRFDTARALGGVTVMAVADAGLAAHDAVVMVGIADGMLPRTPGQASLLSDSERVRLNEALSADLPLATRAGDGDPAGFALGVLSARSELVLTRPRAGVGGNALSASPYFRAAAIALEGTAVAASGVDACSRVERAGPVPLRKPEALHMGAAAWEARRRGDRYTPFEGIVEPADLEHLDPAPPLRGLSPTRLETYAGCPFRFLAENVFGVRRETRPGDRFAIDPRDRGSLVHAALERFLLELGDEPPAEANREEQLALLDATLDGLFADFDDRVPDIPVVWDRTRTSIRSDLHRWWELESADAAHDAGPGWRPFALEVAFGRDDEDDDGHPAVVVATADGDAEIAGRIDRVDVSRDGKAFRVVDYKTGDVSRAETAMQLPVYLRAAAAITSLPVTSGVAEYFLVSRRAGFARSRPEVDAGEGLDASVSRMCASIAAGDFHPEPGTCRATGSCEYPEICGRQVADRARTRSSDPRSRQGEAPAGGGT